MTKVVYLGAWGRSGTTVLADLLGAHPGVFNGGEIRYLWQRGLLDRRLCGCGVRFPRCDLWRRVRQAAWHGSEPDPRHVLNLQNRVVRMRHTPRLLSDRIVDGDGDLAEYTNLLSELYRGITEVTGASVIVDSSKYPSDAALLPRLVGVEPYLVHMVRDPRAVAYSWQRKVVQPDRPGGSFMAGHSVAASSLNWLAVNLAMERVARLYGADHSRRLRYETFIADPAGQVGELLRFLDVEPESGPFVSNDSAVLGPNHTISGNPSRFRTGLINLAPDLEYRTRQPIGTRRLVTTMTLPFLRRYEYPVRLGH